MANFDGSVQGKLAKIPDVPDGGGKPANDDAENYGDIVLEAKERWRICQDAEDRHEAMEDLKFKKGEQWDADAIAQREIDNRPCLTFNNIPAILHQITNDARQNKQSIQVAPVDSGADVEVAKVLEGLIRHIEYDSDADAAYDTALDCAASIGFGFFRLVTEYVDATSFNQTIKIKRIRNPFTVHLDPNAQEADAHDMQYAFISARVPKEEFRREYPNAEMPGATAIGTSVGDNDDWSSQDFCRVAEYYRIEYTADMLVQIADGTTMLKSDPKWNAALQITAHRPTQVPKVMWYKLTAVEVLEKAEIPGPWIPIFPVYGDEIDIDGTVTRNGIIRNAKSPKMMENYFLPLSLSTPVATPEGWSTIGALQPGEQVFGANGSPCDVIGKSPIYINRECFRVEFDDGSSIIADGEHPWMVEERQGPANRVRWDARKLTTRDIEPGRHKIACAKPIVISAASLPVDPYLLGYWLGDGDSDGCAFTVAHADVDEVRERFLSMGLDVGPIHNCAREGDAAHFSVKGQIPALRSLGLIRNKHIPEVYLRASPEQRWALLRGMMDTDGSISTAAQQCTFFNTNVRMVGEFIELLRSLGIKSNTTIRAAQTSKLSNGHEIVSRSDVHMVCFAAPRDAAFSLSRKVEVQARPKRDYSRRTRYWGIKSVTPVPSEPVQCIAVSSADHLFLAGPSMIPTHNTAATEEIAIRTKTPFIGALGQFEGLEADWNQANVRNFSYLEYNPVSLEGALAPPPQRQAPADVPQGYVAMAQLSGDKVKAVTGIYDASLGNRSNEVSGLAIKSRQQQGEISNFHFSDNLTRAITRCAKCLIKWIPKIFDTERVERILGEDRKTAEPVELNKPVQQRDPKTGEIIQKVLNDLTVGDYDVTVSTGPAYNTMRQESAANLIELNGKWPKLMDVAGDLVVRQMDFPDAEAIADRIEKTLPPGLADDKDQQENMVQTPKGPIPAAQAGQLIGQMDHVIQQMQDELDKANKGIPGKQIDAESRERVAEINAQAKHDDTELAGMIELLLAGQANMASQLSSYVDAQRESDRMVLAPMIDHAAQVDAAQDPDHPAQPASIAQGMEQSPAEQQAAEQSPGAPQ